MAKVKQFRDVQFPDVPIPFGTVTIPGKAATVIKNIVTDIGVQSAVDPLTLAGGGGGALGKAGGRVAEAITHLPGTMAQKIPALQRMVDWGTVEPEITAATTPLGRSRVLSAQNQATTRIQDLTNEGRQILARDSRSFKSGMMTHDMQQHLMRRAWHEGTEFVRQRLMKIGFEPSAADRSVPPANILHDIRASDYLPGARGVSSKFVPLLKPGQMARVGTGKTPFFAKKAALDKGKPPDLYNALAIRLGASNKALGGIHGATARANVMQAMTGPGAEAFLAPQRQVGLNKVLSPMQQAQMQRVLKPQMTAQAASNLGYEHLGITEYTKPHQIKSLQTYLGDLNTKYGQAVAAQRSFFKTTGGQTVQIARQLLG